MEGSETTPLPNDKPLVTKWKTHITTVDTMVSVGFWKFNLSVYRNHRESIFIFVLKRLFMSKQRTLLSFSDDR